MNASTPTLTVETAASRTKEIADRVLAPAAADNDKAREGPPKVGARTST
jgi:hypothetical protein